MAETSRAGSSRDHDLETQAKRLLRSLPSVSALLEHEEVGEWLHGMPRAAVVAALQCALDSARTSILSGQCGEAIDIEELIAAAEEELLERSAPSLRHVVNATGIVLHTGLGRAPLSEAAVEAIAQAAGGYCNLEYDLSTGQRGRRNIHVVNQLLSVTGAEAATVVNNNAAATLLILRTLAAGREVVVSRGQLIEIGGSFRLPDIMGASGATLREVGTTNRTRLADYERAIGDRTAMLFRAHPSNYRVVGFTEETSIAEMARLAHRHNIIAVDDLGSGALFDLTPYGLPDEPYARASIQAGADLVCFSGDKLLGGPQCGIIVGRGDLVRELEENPLMRTYRVDKLVLLALQATLACYVDPKEALSRIPALSMLSVSTDQLADRARKLSQLLTRALPDEEFYVCSDVAYAGGGSMPTRELQTVVVQWRPSSASAGVMAAALRDQDIPVIARIRDDAIYLDLRTIPELDFEDLVGALISVVSDSQAEDEE